MLPKYSPAVWGLTPALFLGPALACISPRSMALLFILSAVATLITQTINTKKLPMPDIKLIGVFGIFVVWGLVSYFWTIYPETTISKTLSLGLFFALTATIIPIIKSFNQHDTARIGHILLGGLCLGICVFLIETFNDFYLYDLVRGGNNGDVPDVKQNKAAVLIAIWLFLSFPFLGMHPDFRKRILYFALFPVIYYITNQAESHSARLIFMAAPAFAAIVYFLPARISLLCVLVFASLITFSMPFIARNVAEHTNWQTTDLLNNSLRSRVEIWDQASRRTFEKPFYGWGMNASHVMPNRDEMSVLYKEPMQIAHMHPHNAPIQIWFEAGAVGIGIVIALFALFYRRAIHLTSVGTQKYAAFIWAMTFFYTLSIWGIWQSWFVGTLCLAGVMATAGITHINNQKEV